jgi:hypothetical protein
MYLVFVICIYIHICIFTCAYIHINIYICVYACVYTQIHIYVYVCNIHIYIYICMYTGVHLPHCNEKVCLSDFSNFIQVYSSIKYICREREREILRDRERDDF